MMRGTNMLGQRHVVDVDDRCEPPLGADLGRSAA